MNAFLNLKQFLAKFAITACILATGAMHARAYAFKLTCQYSSATLGSNRTWTIQQELPVTVSVRNEQWQIQTDNGGGVVDSYGCNGTNVFRELYDPNGPTFASPGSITYDDYPADATPCVTLPWLAFCSTKKLDKNIPIPVPWAIARTTPLAYIYRWQVERSSTAPKLPLHITFVTDRDKEKAAAKGVYLVRERLDNQAKYWRSVDYTDIGDRIIGAEYTVLSTTNWSGFEIPTHVELVFFDHRDKLAKKGKPRVRYEIEVNSISPLPGTSDLLPTINKRVDVVDYRLRDDLPLDFAIYPITNRSWPLAITPEMQAALKARRDAETGVRGIIHRAFEVRTFFMTLTALVLLLPPLFILKFRKKNKQQESATA